MDVLYLLMGGICLAEAALFAGRDFLIFTGNIKKDDYDLEKVYSVERCHFIADAV